MKLKDKVAIITGAGRGIGHAIALEFINEGAKVILLDVDTKKTKEVEAQIKHLKGDATFMKCDVTSQKQIMKCVKETLKKHQKIDILVNCAGLFNQKPITEITEKEWDSIITTNLKGTFLCTKSVANHMIDRRKGKIIMVSSIAGKAGLVNTSAFSSANGGIINLTKELTQELSPHNININAVSPGIITTTLMQDMLDDPKTKEDLLAKIPMNRFGTPEEIADSVVFLASSDSDFITGHNLVVDGGWKTH